MEAIKFKTNIMCSGCLAKVTPYLNEAIGADNWEVDTDSPAKILTVVGKTSVVEIQRALEKTGYKAEPV